VSDWERILYRALHAAGLRPIPQYSVEQYDLDFALIAGDRRLDIEVDGERYHRSWTGELCLRDQLRNQRLIELGWEVKRFWVYEVRDTLENCVSEVVQWAKGAGSPARAD
jgi:very-short-patch-repair endonuclease